jgi:hypothetical protein
MIVPTQSADFLKTMGDNYNGQARVEIDTRLCEVRFKGAHPTYLEVMIKLLLGVPERIGDEFVYPVEMPHVGTYDAERDGKLSWNEACTFVLRGALDRAYPGASSLADMDPPVMRGNRMRRLLTGADDEPLLFEVKLPENRS